METKDIIAISLLFSAVLAGIGVTSISYRARALAFLAMIATAVISERLDVNFLSRYYYRGSSRGVEVSFVDVLAFSVLVSSFLFPGRGQTRWRWPAGLGFMLLFFLYALGATAVSEPKIFGFFELSKMLRGLIFFLAAAMFVRGERELGLVVAGLCCAAFFEGAFVMKQRFLEGMYRVAGSLDHANSLSMYLCLIAPVFVAAINSSLPRWLRWFSAAALALTALCSVLTVSRAGVPTFVLVVFGATLFCITWRFTLKKVATVGIVILAAAVVGVKFGSALQERFAESTLAEEYLAENIIDSRGYYLRLAVLIVEDRFFGVGLNNWSYWVSKHYGTLLNTPYSDYDDIPPDFNHEEEDLDMSFAAPAHNLCALTVGELGVPGLALFLLMWLRWAQMGLVFLWRRERTTMGLIGVGLFFGGLGVFLQSITEWIYRQTPIYLTFHALIGVLASLYAVRRRARQEASAAAASAAAAVAWQPREREWVSVSVE